MDEDEKITLPEHFGRVAPDEFDKYRKAQIYICSRCGYNSPDVCMQCPVNHVMCVLLQDPPSEYSLTDAQKRELRGEASPYITVE